MKRLFAGTVAAVLLAGMGWAGGSSTARADYASDRDALCGPGDTDACSIDILNDGFYELTEGIHSGQVAVTGTPGVSSSLQMYALLQSEHPYNFDSVQTYGPPVPFTTDAAGRATVSVPIGVLTAPYGGWSLVAFQLPGATEHTMVTDPVGPPGRVGSVEAVRVRSARGGDDNFMPRVLDGSFEAQVVGGLEGDVYGVQLKVGGVWGDAPHLPVADNGRVGADSFAVVHADVSGYLDGVHPMRIFNRTRGIHDLHLFDFQGSIELKKVIYITPGEHMSAGRRWRTSCEPYSATERCRTEIWSTQVVYSGCKLVKNTGWHFNNLTYKPSRRALWAGNPLGNTGNYTISGRTWRTECDTAVTGRNGCRSYIMADVVQATRSGSGFTYRMVRKEVFNNIVLFTSD